MLACLRKHSHVRSSRCSQLGAHGIALLAFATVLLSTACLPYAVGSSATPVRKGERTRSGSLYYIPNALEVRGDSASVALPGVDYEGRYGISDNADIGVRVTSGLGIVVTAKKRVSGSPAAGGIAIMPGLGIVNFGSHAYGDLTFIASGPERARAMVYGGARVMQVLPIQHGAVHDQPTAGGYLGVRIGSAESGISPELGVYYDHSALGIRSSKFIFVPSVSFHGDDMMRILGGIIERAGPMRRGRSARARSPTR